ncbi:uncharacterized protein K452DRAFT_78736 [Aplosporella prunicola CBS 121167]|uniref:SRR1-like domain-containing protein n=1 Tax=Aplosporella prunicola CBS 121167 TaxID=1176127 RepID=A0A6A6B6V2_9PEZI|nr:uncharacterized protein K452DRAFT_78736 [Aplosporella prunicola CBS 121167]KAF2138964.1 hypothetical protein K452DRAFT_78736 [Aplosporella prunicola CBS 121167]
MPHTARRAPAPPPFSSRTKRATLPLDDGWSVVTTTKSARARPRRRGPPSSTTTTTTTPNGSTRTTLAAADEELDLHGSQDPHDMLTAHVPTGPMPIAPGTTKARVLHRVNTCRTRWAESACAAEVRKLVARAGQARKRGSRLRRAVCLGLGSLSGENAALCARSVWQLVAFLELVKLVTGRDEASGEDVEGEKVDVQVYAEDPVFNALDEEVLRDVGVVVLRAAEGEVAASAQHIAPDCMVFAPFMPWFVMLPHFLRDRHPALYIGSDVADMLEAAQRRADGHDATPLDHVSVLAARASLAQNRDTAPFPLFDLLDGALNPMVVSWVKREDDDDDDDDDDEREKGESERKEDADAGEQLVEGVKGLHV